MVTYPVTDIGRIATSIYFINIYKRYYSDIVRDKPSRDVIINSVFYNCPTAPASVREEGTTVLPYGPLSILICWDKFQIDILSVQCYL